MYACMCEMYQHVSAWYVYDAYGHGVCIMYVCDMYVLCVYVVFICVCTYM